MDTYRERSRDPSMVETKTAETDFNERSYLLPSTSTSLYECSFVPARPEVRIIRGRRPCCLIVSLGILLVVASAATLGVVFGVILHSAPESLPQSIKISDLMQHLKELEAIAKQYNNSRSIENGYNASAEMFKDKLKTAGYNVTTQHFMVPSYQDLAPNNAMFYASYKGLDYQWKFLQGVQYALMRYSGSTPGGQAISATLQPVTGGCSLDDFRSFENGSVALLDYNVSLVNCTLFNMAANAKAANASAVVWGRGASEAGSLPPTTRVYRQTASSVDTVDIPMLGATYELKSTLMSLWKIAADNNVTLDVQLKTYTSVTSVYTYNVLATTNGGNDSAVIVVGSHLDSVTAGPGINDNGSGSAANLEIALQVATRKVHNKVRFAFWSAEELGLLGSYHYVMNLTPEEKRNIALNLNFDMLGSPNFVRGVYNGSGALAAISTQCGNIQALFERNFKDNNLSYEIWPFSGRSDYGPFIAQGVNIPAGSIATGADSVKTIDERTAYGGFASTILDPCYHAACDTVENVNEVVYIQMAQSAAYVLEQLMMKDDLASFLMSSPQ